MDKILIINGPNLNMLGKREKSIYGEFTLEEIQKFTEEGLKKNNKIVHLEWFQSNIEGEIVEKLQEASGKKYRGIVINPGGYSHTSVAILDALMLIRSRKVEVHISQIFKREEFRQNLITAKASDFVMSGLGKSSYLMAILALFEREE